MKKILFVLPVTLLVAAGCNSSQPTVLQTQPVQQIQTTPTQQQQVAQSPEPTPVPSPTPTGTDKTYTNASYGFSFIFPSVYTIKTSDKTNVPGELFWVSIVGPAKGKNLGSASSMSVSVWSNSEQQSLLDWATANSSFSNYSSGSFNTDFKNETLGGHQAISYSWQGEGYGKTVVIANGQNVLLLDTGPNSKTDQVWQDFDGITSTFKFSK
jgi:hypothetical protein